MLGSNDPIVNKDNHRFMLLRLGRLIKSSQAIRFATCGLVWILCLPACEGGFFLLITFLLSYHSGQGLPQSCSLRAFPRLKHPLYGMVNFVQPCNDRGFSNTCPEERRRLLWLALHTSHH